MISIETTKNYALPKWKKSDFIQMDDFNDAFAKLDTALKAEADARAAADSTASKALSALEQTVTKSKLCRIKYGSYTGNGKTGKANANTLSCDFYPVLLIISTVDQYPRRRHTRHQPVCKRREQPRRPHYMECPRRKLVSGNGKRYLL